MLDGALTRDEHADLAPDVARGFAEESGQLRRHHLPRIDPTTVDAFERVQLGRLEADAVPSDFVHARQGAGLALLGRLLAGTGGRGRACAAPLVEQSKRDAHGALGLVDGLLVVLDATVSPQ